MLGLIIKDFIQLRRIMKAFIGIAVLYILLSLLQKSNGLLVTLGIIMCTLSGVNSLAMDQQSKWDEYALTLPFDRTKLVVAKYVMLVVLAVTASIVTMLIEACAFGVGMNVLEVGATVFFSSLTGVSILLPALYKFGIEKGRYILMALVMIPFAVMLLLDNMGQSIPTEFLTRVMESIDRAPWLLVAGIAALVMVSMLISVIICKKKEY